MKQWYVYMVRCADGSLYTGITTDVKKRIKAHNESTTGARYTLSRRPVRLCYESAWPDRSSAAQEECRIKKLSRLEKLALCV